MASVTAFNEMMGQFLMELHRTFPEEKGLKKCMSAFDLMKETNPRLVVDGFMANVSPYADKLSSRDERDSKIIHPSWYVKGCVLFINQ